MNLKTVVFFIAIFLLFAPNVLSESFIRSPLINDRITVNNEINGSVIVDGDFDSLKAELISPSYDIFYSEISSNETFSFNEEYIDLPGTYKLRFNKGNETFFPKFGYFKIDVVRDESFYLEHLNKYVLNDSNSVYCEPFNNSFECGYEHFQAYEINRFSKLNHFYPSEGYDEKLKKLIDSNWSDSTVNPTCSPPDFSCGDITDDSSIGDNREYSGSLRQGIILRELWDSYKFNRNKTIKEYAINFSNTGPSSCDIFDGDYSCGTSEDIGLLIQGYSKSYLNTLNESYLDIVKGLIDYISIEEPHPELVRGFFKANKFIEENLLYDSFKMLKELLNECSDCEKRDYLSKQLMLIDSLNYISSNYINFREFDDPFEYKVYRKMFDLFNEFESSCSHNQDNYSCNNPEVQNYQIRIFNSLTYHIENVERGFFDFSSSGIYPRNNANISIKFSGEINEPKINIRDFGEDEFESYELNDDGVFDIPEDYLDRSNFVEIYFSDGNINFPEYGYFKQSVHLESQARDILYEIGHYNPNNFCSPFSEDASFNCRYEFMQGQYLSGLNNLNNIDESFVDVLSNLVSQDLNPWFSTCDPNLNNYECSLYSEDPFLEFIKDGVYRASSLSLGYLKTYSKTNDNRLLKDAEILLNQEWSDCNLFNNDFNCSEKNQGKLLYSLNYLYEKTGDKFYLNWIDEVSSELIDNDYNTPFDLLGLTSVSVHIEEDHSDYVYDGLNSSFYYCSENDCDFEYYYTLLESAWKAYGVFREPEFYILGVRLFDLGPEGDLYCNPIYSEHYPQKYTCDYPHEQGKMISAYSTLQENYVPTDDPEELEIIMTSNETGKMDDELNVTCTVRNLDEENPLIGEREIRLITDQELIEPESHELEIGNDLNEGDEPREFNFLLNLTYGGRSSNFCRVLGFEDSKQIVVTNIGEIIETEHNSYVNEFNNESLFINFTNLHPSNLENLSISFNSSLNFSSINSTENTNIFNDRIEKDFLEGEDIFNSTFNFENTTDEVHNILLNSSSEFGGSSYHNLTFMTVENNLSVSFDYPEKSYLYDFDLVSINISNDKPFDLNDIYIKNYNNHSKTIFNNVSNHGFNIKSNESKVINLTVEHLISGFKNFTIGFYSDQGINYSENISFNVSNEILDIESLSKDVDLNQEFITDFSIRNIIPRNQSNITLDFYNSSNLRIEEIILPEFYNSSLEKEFLDSSNFSEIDENYINLSREDHSKNITSMWKNDTSFFINFTYDYLVNNSELNIFYEYEGSENGTISLLKDNQTEKLNCSISYQENFEKCKFSLPMNSNSSELIFDFNSSGNLTLNYLYLENEKLIPIKKMEKEDNSILIYNLSPNESMTFSPKLISSSDDQYLEINSTSLENGTGYGIIDISEKTYPSPSGGGGGDESTGPISSPPPPSLIEKWNYTSMINTFKSLNYNSSYLKDYLEEINITSINFTKTEENLNCINSYRELNKSSNMVKLSVSNNCKNLTSDFFIIDLIPYDEIISKYDSFNYTEIQNISSSGTIIRLPNLNYTDSVLIEYQIYNNTLNENTTYFEELYLHIQNPENLTKPFLGPPEMKEVDDITNIVGTSSMILNQFKSEYFSYYVPMMLVIFLTLFSLFLYNIYFFITDLYENPYKYLMGLKKRSYFLFELADNYLVFNKSGSVVDPKVNKAFSDLNLRLRYLEKLIKSDNLKEARSVFSKLIDLSDSYLDMIKENENESTKDRMNYLSKRISDLNQLLLIKEKSKKEDLESSKRKEKSEKINEDSSKKTEKSKDDDSSESSKESKKEEVNPEEEDDNKEFDIFVKILKIKHLINDGKLDEASRVIKRTGYKIDDLDDILKKDEKEHLGKKLNKLKKKNENLKRTSKKYRLKKYFERKKKDILDKFSKSDSDF